jgi:hypothetical protein
MIDSLPAQIPRQKKHPFEKGNQVCDAIITFADQIAVAIHPLICHDFAPNARFGRPPVAAAKFLPAQRHAFPNRTNILPLFLTFINGLSSHIGSADRASHELRSCFQLRQAHIGFCP